MRDELTTKMHSEFFVSNETQKKHTAWSVLKQLRDFPNLTTRERLLALTDLTESDLEKYRIEWEYLINDTKSD